MITDFTEHDLKDSSLRDFQNRVRMKYDADIDAQFPEKWQGTVVVKCKSGDTLSESTKFAKGDPELPLTR
jgi:aconitate decarboxylase